MDVGGEFKFRIIEEVLAAELATGSGVSGDSVPNMRATLERMPEQMWKKCLTFFARPPVVPNVELFGQE